MVRKRKLSLFVFALTASYLASPQKLYTSLSTALVFFLFLLSFSLIVFFLSFFQLVNRHKNNKKKTPTPLTEEIINEMNKQQIGGFDNYGADDLYGMDDVWNDRGYEKPPKKVKAIAKGLQNPLFTFHSPAKFISSSCTDVSFIFIIFFVVFLIIKLYPNATLLSSILIKFYEFFDLNTEKGMERRRCAYTFSVFFL